MSLGRRTSASLHLANAAAALDRLLHGAAGARGWGRPSGAVLDPTLLTVRGFDPAGRRFLYAVNPRFAAPVGARAAGAAPFALVLDIRVDVGPDRTGEQYKDLLRGRPGEPEPSVETIKARFFRAGLNELVLITRQRDSLALTDAQVAALEAIGRDLDTMRDSIYTALAVDLMGRVEEMGSGVLARRIAAARRGAAEALARTLPRVEVVLTPEQRERVLPLLRQLGAVPGSPP